MPEALERLQESLKSQEKMLEAIQTQYDHLRSLEKVPCAMERQYDPQRYPEKVPKTVMMLLSSVRALQWLKHTQKKE